MSKTPFERLQEATRKREDLRRRWDSRRNRDLLQLLQVTVPAMMACERFGLFLRDPDSGALWIEAGTGVTERAIVVAGSDSMVGESIRMRAPISRQDLSSAHGAHRSVAGAVGFVTRDALTVPIFAARDGRPVGALQVINKLGGGGWTEQDARLLQAVAHSISGSVVVMQEGQHLLAEARDLDNEIAALDKTESAIRGGHMLRTFEPALELSGGGYLHSRYQGTMLPPFIDNRATEDLADCWHTGPNDIFLCTHQKVGTHLAKKFLVELVRKALPLPEGNIYTTGDIGKTTVPWPSVMYSQRGRAAWEEHIARTHDQPRLWYIHAGYSDIPIEKIHPETKFIVVFRDPRAVAVSQYFFYKRHPLLQVPDNLQLDAFVERFIGGDLYFGDYHRHVMGWLYRSDDRISKRQLLALRYEDLVENKHACAHTLLDFLAPGTAVDAAIIDEIVASTSFKTMKKELSENPQSFHLNPKVYFRAGKTNDWEQHLSPVAQDAINAKTRALWGSSLDAPLLTEVRSLQP